MARKKNQSAQTEPRTKSSFEMKSTVHKKFKMLSVTKGLPMQAMFEAALEMYLASLRKAGDAV